MDEGRRGPTPWPATLALAVIPVAIAGTVGSAATLPAIPSWYVTLAKPWFTPPNSIFGPVWTALYVLMAFACARILRQPTAAGRARPIAAFLAQIVLNGAWSVAFFGLRSPALGMAVILPLWAAIVWTLALFWRRDVVAGACLVPYLVWTSFAVALNAAIWRLNG